jgi:DNA invertase Pin-like site-specific DNA recombinase
VDSDRDRLTEQLRVYGDRRRAARAVEREQLDAIAMLLPQALSLGISKREIARLTGVSRPWIEALIKRDASDARR